MYKTSLKIAEDLSVQSSELDVSKILSYGLDVDDYDLGNDFRVVAVKDKRPEGRNYEFLFGVGK